MARYLSLAFLFIAVPCMLITTGLLTGQPIPVWALAVAAIWLAVVCGPVLFRLCARSLARLRSCNDAPRNVRVRRPDGTEIPCVVLRTPDADEPGFRMWLVIPAGGYLVREGDAVCADLIPPNTALKFETAPPGA